MLAYARSTATPPRHRPAFVYDVPCVVSASRRRLLRRRRVQPLRLLFQDVGISPKTKTKTTPKRPVVRIHPLLRLLLLLFPRLRTHRTPTAPRTRTRRYSPVPEPSDEDEEESELEFDSHHHASPSPSSDDEGAGWHYTYASASSVSHRRRQHHDDVKPIPIPISFHSSSSPTSPKRELSDANERRLSAELRRSPIPSHTAPPAFVLLSTPAPLAHPRCAPHAR